MWENNKTTRQKKIIAINLLEIIEWIRQEKIMLMVF